MADRDITLWLDSHKYDALEKALTTEGADLLTVAQAALDAIYEQEVPAQQRREIDETIVREYEEAARIAQEQAIRNQRLGVFRVTENSQVTCFQSDIYITQQAAARRCAIALRDKKAARDHELIATAFMVRETISEPVYEQYCATSDAGPKAMAIADIDFDEGRYSILLKGIWTDYPMKEITTLANNTERLKYGKDELFITRLRLIEPMEHDPGQGLGQSL